MGATTSPITVTAFDSPLGYRCPRCWWRDHPQLTTTGRSPVTRVLVAGAVTVTVLITALAASSTSTL